jgi:phospholipid/cholesterol/gamma-HCH transport system substrate-binding protein
MSAKGLQQNNIAETLIGALVVAVALAFLALAYLRTGSGSLSGYEVNAHLAKVDGLGVGTDVRISGIKVGSVSGMDLDPKNYLVTVHMSIRDDIKLPTDSSMIINSAGILGSSYLSITPGGDDHDIAPGGFIQNTQAANASDLMGLAGRFIGGDTGKAAPRPAVPAPPPPQNPGAGP